MITEDGEVTNDTTEELLRDYMVEFYAFITRVYPVVPKGA